MIALIRHGQTAGNMMRRYVGGTDEPITEKGKEDLIELRKTGMYPVVNAVFSSPMKRCLETAETIYPMQKPTVIADLREISFGEFEGFTYDEITKKVGFEGFKGMDENVIFPGGESYKAFRKRCLDAFEEIPKNDKTAVFVHGGVVMAIMSCLFGDEVSDIYDFCPLNGRGYIITENESNNEKRYIKL